MHCKIIDCHFDAFFQKYNSKKKTRKSGFWAPEFGGPDWYTSLPNNLNTSLQVGLDFFFLFTLFILRIKITF